MKCIAGGAHSARGKTGKRARAHEVRRRHPADCPNDYSKRGDGDDRNGEEAFKPLLSEDHLVPMRGRSEDETHRGEDSDYNERQCRNNDRRLSLPAGSRNPDQVYRSRTNAAPSAAAVPMTRATLPVRTTCRRSTCSTLLLSIVIKSSVFMLLSSVRSRRLRLAVPDAH